MCMYIVRAAKTFLLMTDSAIQSTTRSSSVPIYTQSSSGEKFPSGGVRSQNSNRSDGVSRVKITPSEYGKSLMFDIA